MNTEKSREQKAESRNGESGNRSQGTGLIRNRQAFTLIELLVVIAIIGLLATLISGLSVMAARKKKIARVDAEKHLLMTAIDNYHDKMGFYPPDGVRFNDQNTASTNQLLFELTGCSYAPVVGTAARLFKAINVDDHSAIDSDNTTKYYAKGGIANSAQTPDLPANFYKMALKTSQYQPYDNNTNIVGLIVPVDLDALNGAPNFWYYDSSSTNRHNPDSFDLWAVFSAGKNTITNGNWPQQ